MAAEKLSTVAAALQQTYRTPPWQSSGNPLDELIATVLSQHTSDLNTARAFASLKSTFPDWEAVVAAPTFAVANAIRCGGLAESKAPRIQSILRALDRDGDDPTSSLEDLSRLSVAAARRSLLDLPGVGPKTASCVLLFSLGMPAFPVDTHVDRLARRIGLVPPASKPEQTQDAVESYAGDDRDTLYRLHLNLIRHGRAVCTARRPRCAECVLAQVCDYAAAAHV